MAARRSEIAVPSKENIDSIPIIIHTVNMKGKTERAKFSNKNSQIDFARVQRERAHEGWSWRVLAKAENQLQAIPSLAGIYS